MIAAPQLNTMSSNRRRTVLIALSVASLSAAGAMRRPVPVPHANPVVTINVDAALNRHPIDPRIYGVAFAKPATFADLGVTINRWGGNATSRHNWEINTTNRAKDYFFENIPDEPAAAAPGTAADNFIQPTLTAGLDALITIPMMGMLPFDNSIRCGYSVALYGGQGCCDAVDGFRPDCGDGRSGGNRLLGINDPADTSVVFPSSHEGNWVQHMVDTHGAAASGGVRYYALDNEPSLWSFDHWDVHPAGATTDEVWNKMADYGAAIKAKDPTALITGVEEWGWDGYFYSGIDQENYGQPGWPADRLAHGNIPYAEYLLQQARDYEQSNGTRILDFFSLHFYPQGGEFCCPFDDVSPTMQLLRNRSTRGLWDPAYVNESYIGGTGIDSGIVRLIPRLRQWANDDYPGTKIGVTEYNWGAEAHINGATAQADILGIFGREGLDMGVRWTVPETNSLVYKAIGMYRNYDGVGSKFGDVSAGASGPNPDDVSTFAALRSSDGALTIMIIAKTPGTDYDVAVNLQNINATGPADRWQLDSGGITHLAGVPIGGVSPQLSLTVPAQSITLLVMGGQYLGAPSNLDAHRTSATNIALSWIGVPGIGGTASYEVWRSSGGAPYTFIGTNGTIASYQDSDPLLAANTTYLYKVRAASAGLVSGFSNVDAATTIDFTDDPLNSDTPVKVAHVTELRTAVNAMRAAAGLGAQAFTDSSLNNVTIKAVHIRELRRGLNQARAWIGLPPVVYSDPAITPQTTAIKKQSIIDLRSGVK